MQLQRLAEIDSKVGAGAAVRREPDGPNNMAKLTVVKTAILALLLYQSLCHRHM
jgi:hypothetical protein